MTDLRVRADELRERVKRKRDDIQHHLDGRFYNTCRDILTWAEALDQGSIFLKDPSKLHKYSLVVATPMWWQRIRRNLTQYRYAAPKDFIDDMRLIVENCYAYNAATSAASATARTIELFMEDAFVKELGELPPSMKEIKDLSRKPSHEVSKEILRIYELYEMKDAQVTNSKTSISLSTCRCATRRRILEVLRDASKSKDGGGNRAPAVRRAPPSSATGKGAAAPVKVPHKAPAGNTAATPAAPAPSRSLLQTAAEPTFHEVVAAPTNLERVPQNERTDGFTLRDISPARLDEGMSDDEDSSDFTPLRSDEVPGAPSSLAPGQGFSPVGDRLPTPTDGPAA